MRGDASHNEALTSSGREIYSVARYRRGLARLVRDIVLPKRVRRMADPALRDVKLTKLYAVFPLSPVHGRHVAPDCELRRTR